MEINHKFFQLRNQLLIIAYYLNYLLNFLKHDFQIHFIFQYHYRF